MTRNSLESQKKKEMLYRKSACAWIGILSALGVVSGCATAKTRILPRQDGAQVIIAQSYSEADAYDAALRDATEHCKKSGQRFVIVEERTQYQGIDKNAKAGMRLVGSLLGQPATVGTMSSVDDNKVTVTFRCN